MSETEIEGEFESEAFEAPEILEDELLERPESEVINMDELPEAISEFDTEEEINLEPDIEEEIRPVAIEEASSEEALARPESELERVQMEPDQTEESLAGEIPEPSEIIEDIESPEIEEPQIEELEIEESQIEEVQIEEPQIEQLEDIFSEPTLSEQAFGEVMEFQEFDEMEETYPEEETKDIGRIYSGIEEEVVDDMDKENFDVNKPSGMEKLDKFLSNLAEDETSLKQVFSKTSVSSKSDMPKYLHDLFTQEKPPDEEDEFAWPNYVFTDRDQIYENLITKTMCNGTLMALDGEHVLIRRDHGSMGTKVRLLGGGKAGTEPLYSGYIGKGMLTGAVIGDRNEAPKVSAIDKAINELSTNFNNGILILIQNSYENRVTFGLAMQRARQRGVLIDMITVSDDCFEDKRPGGAGRPGLTGILFTIKIAGAMSEKGRQMKEIFITCRTILMASISCHILADQVKIGTSYQAEDGTRLDIRDIKLKEMITWLLQYLTHPCRYFSLPLSPLNQIALLVNSYTQDSMFLYSATAEIVRQLNKLDVDIERIYSGNYVTSRGGQRGLSITIMKLYDETLLEWLDDPVQVEAWHGMVCGQTPNIMKSISTIVKPIEPFGPKFPPEYENKLPHILNYVCRAVLTVEPVLNSYDMNRYTGSAIARGASALGQLNKTKNVDCRSAYSFLKQISMTLENGMSGSIGALYGLIFQGAAEAFLCYSKYADMEPWMWGKALEGAVTNIVCFGKLKEGDCTLLDALLPPLKKFNELIEQDSHIPHDGVLLMHEFLIAAREGMNLTRSMRNRNHFPGEPEVGTYAVTVIFSAILEAIK